MISKESEVTDFLECLKGILEKDDFNVDQNLILIQKKKPHDEEHSTPYTLVDLEYDLEDVIARLKELTISEYSETKIDKDNLDPPLLFVFGKDINRKLVYMKLKIKESDNQGRCILCVSFHYAKDKMNFPYA